MENFTETNQEIVNGTMTYAEGPIGNKFENLLEGQELIGIAAALAESFINKAKKDMLPFMRSHDLNFNKEGIYEVSYSLLDNVRELMEENEATYLTFTFVEISPNNPRLQVTPYSEAGMIYMIASLQTQDKTTIGEHNYLIINANQQLSLKDLKISNKDFEDLKITYKEHGRLIMDAYFRGKTNTLSISYHIVDLIDTLHKESCNKFIVNLSTISDVKKLVAKERLGTIKEAQYRAHFESHLDQMTLVFKGNNNYYDMGSLYP